MPPDIRANLDLLLQKIEQAAKKAKRPPQSITLIAVSKGKPFALIREASLSGQKNFGENYVQEFSGKFREGKSLSLRWDFVGHLQRRKAKEVVGKVELIHSLDSYQLALVLAKEAAKKGVVQKCLLQINLAGEKTKSGIPSNQAAPLLEEMNGLTPIEVVGLMTIPPFFAQAERSRPFFRLLKDLKDLLNSQKVYRSQLKELSMGMSHDFPIAIEEGATLIRVGTTLFGERNFSLT